MYVHSQNVIVDDVCSRKLGSKPNWILLIYIYFWPRHSQSAIVVQIYSAPNWIFQIYLHLNSHRSQNVIVIQI